MGGQPIAELNAGLVHLKEQLLGNDLAKLRVELSVVSFNRSTTVEVDFTSPDNFSPPTLIASGGTHLGAAICEALDMLRSRTDSYRTAGLSYFRPWLVLLTDAEANDDVSDAARRVKEAESQRRLAFFGIGVQSADMRKLAELSLRPPLHLDGLRFADLFEWLSTSLSSVATSQPGEQVPLPPPNWGVV